MGSQREGLLRELVRKTQVDGRPGQENGQCHSPHKRGCSPLRQLPFQPLPSGAPALSSFIFLNTLALSIWPVEFLSCIPNLPGPPSYLASIQSIKNLASLLCILESAMGSTESYPDIMPSTQWVLCAGPAHSRCSVEGSSGVAS